MASRRREDPVLETERLLLRLPVEADFEPWAAMMEDEENSRFIGGPVPRAAAWRGMAAMAGSWALHGFGMFSVIEKSSGRWIGRVGPWRPAEWPGTEIGWGIARHAWGRGYATEAAAATIDWAFAALGWTEVIHCIAPENAASAGVARRLGSTLRGPGRLPPPFQTLDIEIWGQTREQWEARRGSQPGGD